MCSLNLFSKIPFTIETLEQFFPKAKLIATEPLIVNDQTLFSLLSLKRFMQQCADLKFEPDGLASESGRGLQPEQPFDAIAGVSVCEGRDIKVLAVIETPLVCERPLA